MKPLVETGHVYIACPPLYRVYNSRKEIYCWDDTDLANARNNIGQGYKVNRYKGLGEMNYEQLSSTTMAPEHRKLIQVLIHDDDDAHDKVDLFLGKDSDRRKDWIDNNIDFSTKDTFTQEVAREK
jgi:topoisomerase-4 subunit B